MDDKYYLMWLLSIDGISGQKTKYLLDRFGNAENIWRCGEQELREIPSIAPQLIDSIMSAKNEDRLYELIENLEDNDYGFVSINCKEYPKLLREIRNPPLGLFINGRLPESDVPMVGIIGSRKCTEYGLAVAEKLSQGLAEYGVAVVSGMARGIDGMAHKGAINGGGVTVAVLGCGIDVCYPPEHLALREDIIKNGCVLSEYPLGRQPEKYFFPERNRIISGMCAAVVVVEAEKRSGTSITVDEALNQGREVMAVPGSIFSKYSIGTNNLINAGAAPVTCVEDIIAGLRVNVPAMRGSGAETKGRKAGTKKPPLAFDENLVYACINLEPLLFDDLLAAVNLSIQDLQYTLVNLEINGYIRRLSGQRYIRRT